jgi:hypothetical protein
MSRLEGAHAIGCPVPLGAHLDCADGTNGVLHRNWRRVGPALEFEVWESLLQTLSTALELTVYLPWEEAQHQHPATPCGQITTTRRRSQLHTWRGRHLSG